MSTQDARDKAEKFRIIRRGCADVLTDANRLLLIEILDRDSGAGCWESTKSLAQALAWPETKVHENLRKLTERGFIWTEHTGIGRGCKAVRRINWAEIEAAHRRNLESPTTTGITIQDSTKSASGEPKKGAKSRTLSAKEGCEISHPLDRQKGAESTSKRVRNLAPELRTTELKETPKAPDTPSALSGDSMSGKPDKFNGNPVAPPPPRGAPEAIRHEFAALLAIYPNRDDGNRKPERLRSQALAAYWKQRSGGRTLEFIEAKVGAFAELCAIKGTDPRYVPQFRTFLEDHLDDDYGELLEPSTPWHQTDEGLTAMAKKLGVCTYAISRYEVKSRCFAEMARQRQGGPMSKTARGLLALESMKIPEVEVRTNGAESRTHSAPPELPTEPPELEPAPVHELGELVQAIASKLAPKPEPEKPKPQPPTVVKEVRPVVRHEPPPYKPWIDTMVAGGCEVEIAAAIYKRTYGEMVAA